MHCNGAERGSRRVSLRLDAVHSPHCVKEDPQTASVAGQSGKEEAMAGRQDGVGAHNGGSSMQKHIMGLASGVALGLLAVYGASWFAKYLEVRAFP